MKLTVSEYAKRLNVSVQTVYKKIKRGSIETFKENGITYVVDDIEEIKTEVKHEDKTLLKLVKTLMKENKQLRKDLRGCNKGKEKVYLSYIAELKQLQLSHHNTDIIEVKTEVKPSKKKKNRKKNKKS